MAFNDFKVSVITPVHNDRKYISDTIISILNQTHKNLELIIIDDFSDEETKNIIKSFKDERIVLIENSENKGAAYCRNTGIKHATGEYVAFLDGDDIWKENKLELQLKFMIDNDYSFSCTEYEVIDDEGNSLKYRVSGPKKMNHKKFLRVDYSGCSTVMFKRSVYPDLSIPTTITKRNDYALWIKLSERVDCYFLHIPLTKYRKRTDSISSGKKYKLLKYHRILFIELYGFSKIKAWFYANRNAVYYICKRIKYYKKLNK